MAKSSTIDYNVTQTALCVKNIINETLVVTLTFIGIGISIINLCNLKKKEKEKKREHLAIEKSFNIISVFSILIRIS